MMVFGFASCKPEIQTEYVYKTYASTVTFTVSETETEGTLSVTMATATEGAEWKWCWNWYGIISSTSAASGSHRVKRGGSSWSNNASSCAVSSRYYDSPQNISAYPGFLVVRTAK